MVNFFRGCAGVEGEADVGARGAFQAGADGDADFDQFAGFGVERAVPVTGFTEVFVGFDDGGKFGLEALVVGRRRSVGGRFAHGTGEFTTGK